MKLAIPRSLLLGAAAAAFPVVGASDGLRIDGGSEFGWEDNWYVQVDGVMGGKSSGKIEFLEDNSIMKFTGDIILDGGGFSSVRRRIDLDLSEYAGVVVTVEAAIAEGTTPPPGFHLQFGDGKSYYDFSSAFAVPLSNSDSDGTVVTSIYLPMDSFNRGSRGGFQCRGTCELDPSDINGMSVYMLFQEGGFDVRLRSIEAVEEPRAFPLPEYDGLETSDDIIGLIRNTVSSGGGLYDKSYVELCINMYWSVLNTVLSLDSEVASESIKAVICAGLQQVEDQMDVGDTKQNIAWTLRYAMDAVIADLQGSSRTAFEDWLPTVDEASSMEVLCVGRTSPAQGFMYDPTNEYILVSESEDDEEVPPSNSQIDEEAEEPLIGTENDDLESPSVSEETEKESPIDNEEKEQDPLSNSETESNESLSNNREEEDGAQIDSEEEQEEENAGEPVSESDTKEDQPQGNKEEEEIPLSSSENEEGEEGKEVEDLLSEVDIDDEMPQASKEQEEEPLTSSENEGEQEEKEVEEPLSEVDIGEEMPQASKEQEEESLTSTENEGDKEESLVSNQVNQGEPPIVSEAEQEKTSSNSGMEDQGLTNSTLSFDGTDPVIKASTVDSSQFSSGSPALLGYGFGSVVAGFMLLGTVQ